MDVLTVYAVAELVLSVHITLSNLLVLWVYVRTRSVRTVTNTYIFSLALTDFLAGALGIPVTVWSVLTRKPNDYFSCVSVHLILCILCTISTFHMLAIAVDKYTTICCGRIQLLNGRHSRAVLLLTSSWVVGTLIAIIPLFDAFQMSREAFFESECHFTVVVDYRYLVYVIFFGTILIPSAMIVYFYVSIYSRIRKEEAQVKCLLNKSERERRIMGRRKLLRILLILVLTYGVCWYPLYIINTVNFYLPGLHTTPTMTLAAVVLSHMSCALNPLIYAYGMPGFKKALRSYFHIAVSKSKLSCKFTTAFEHSKTMQSTCGRQNRSVSVQAREAPRGGRKISAPTPPRSLAARRQRRLTVDGNELRRSLDIYEKSIYV